MENNTTTETLTTNEPAVQAPAAAPQQETAVVNPNNITLTDEQRVFIENNGGFDKVFNRAKMAISAPEQKKEVAPVENVEQKQAISSPEVPQYQPKQAPKGFITPEEYMVEQYFRGLSNEEKYSGISEQIRSGEVLKEMAEFGIHPTQDGMFNDVQIRKFLDLKAQTVPAVQTAAPITNIPTVEWSPVEKIDSFESAQKVIQENLTRPGMEHPKTAEAKEFLKSFFK